MKDKKEYQYGNFTIITYKDEDDYYYAEFGVKYGAHFNSHEKSFGCHTAERALNNLFDSFLRDIAVKTNSYCPTMRKLFVDGHFQEIENIDCCGDKYVDERENRELAEKTPNMPIMEQ